MDIFLNGDIWKTCLGFTKDGTNCYENHYIDNILIWTTAWACTCTYTYFSGIKMWYNSLAIYIHFFVIYLVRNLIEETS